MGSDGVPRRSRDPRFPAADLGGWRITVDTGTTGLDSADIAIGRSDPGGRRSDPAWRSDPDGRPSDTGGRSDTRCCRLVAGGHGDTVSRPPRTMGGQGT
jgi:hypothetical protein